VDPKFSALPLELVSARDRITQGSRATSSALANDPWANNLKRQFREALSQFSAEKLPSYMLPAAFVVMDKLPLTDNGKVDRRELPPPWDKQVAQTIFEPPRTPLEKALSEIWGQLLSLEQVGVEDNFFRLGGHSLLAVRLVAKIAERTRRELSVAAIFRHPNIRSLALYLEQVPELSGTRTSLGVQGLEEGTI